MRRCVRFWSITDVCVMRGAEASHYLYRLSTTRLELACYLQDLFTRESERGRGIGRLLIEGVYQMARAAGVKRVYWHTHETNAAGRLLYDKMAKNAGFIVYGQEL